MRTALFLLLATLPAAARDDDDETFSIPPRLVSMDMPNSTLGKVAPTLGRAGYPFTFPAENAGQTCDGIFNRKPYWSALEAVASQTGHRIALGDGGRKIALEPRGKAYEVSSVHGAFRIVARQVVGKFQLDTGITTHDVQLDVHWEPRIPVFRLDSEPKIDKAVDDKDRPLAVAPAGSKSQPTGCLHSTHIRTNGITRESKRIGTLKGNFTVTASAKMLPFEFADLTQGKSAVELEMKEKVKASLKSVEKDENVWEFRLELDYPSDIPKFESFESWTHLNSLKLVAPGGKSFTPDDSEVLTQGSRITAVYRFKENVKNGLVNPAAKGWKLTCDVASPPVEFSVPFELKDIPLP